MPCDLPTAGTLGRRRKNVSRLLLILTEFPPSFGGMQTHAIHLCRYLHQRGYQIEVATYRGPAVEFPFPVHRCLSRIGFTQNLQVLESLTRIARPDLLYSSTIFYGRLSASTGIPMIARSVGNDVLRPWIREYLYWAADQFVLASREHCDARTGLRDVETKVGLVCDLPLSRTDISRHSVEASLAPLSRCSSLDL